MGRIPDHRRPPLNVDPGLHENEVFLLLREAPDQRVQRSRADRIGVEVQEALERALEGPELPVHVTERRPETAARHRHDGHIERVLRALEAFPRHAGVAVPDALDEHAGQMEVAG